MAALKGLWSFLSVLEGGGQFTPKQFTPGQYTPGLDNSLNEASSFGK